MRMGSYPSDRIKRLYDINVHGAFFTAREAAKCMIPQGGGSIILIASMSANVCLPFRCSHLLHQTFQLSDRQCTTGNPLALTIPKLVDLVAKLQSPYNGSKAGISLSVGLISEGYADWVQP